MLMTAIGPRHHLLQASVFFATGFPCAIQAVPRISDIYFWSRKYMSEYLTGNTLSPIAQGL